MVKNHVLLIFLGMILVLSGCTKPVAKSLLSSASESTGTTDTSDDSEDTSNEPLDIQPDNGNVIVNVDDKDIVEISGTCKDLDRRKNRILVEVFAGEDENLSPYIANDTSDQCLTTDAGLTIGSKCFWITQGQGFIENLGLPDEKRFPQCHNGRFSFSVKLGQILRNTLTGTNNRYTVRFKLRTTEGLLADSAWGRVLVDRGLNVPTIDKADFDNSAFSCKLEMSPARFNQGIFYNITRSYTDSANPAVSAINNLFTINKNSQFNTTGDSVYSWTDGNLAFHSGGEVTPGILSGVKYTYTLQASYDNTPFTAVTQISNSSTCELAPPILDGGPSALASCSVFLKTTPQVPALNPGLGVTVAAQYGMSSVNPSWTGVDLNGAINGVTVIDVTPSCTGTPTSCSITGLTSGTTYYFAVREVGYGQTGKWSNTLPCKAP